MTLNLLLLQREFRLKLAPTAPIRAGSTVAEPSNV